MLDLFQATCSIINDFITFLLMFLKPVVTRCLGNLKFAHKLTHPIKRGYFCICKLGLVLLLAQGPPTQDKLHLIGQTFLLRFQLWKWLHLHTVHFCSYEAKLPSLKLKTNKKNLQVLSLKYYTTQTNIISTSPRRGGFEALTFLSTCSVLPPGQVLKIPILSLKLKFRLRNSFQRKH